MRFTKRRNERRINRVALNDNREALLRSLVITPEDAEGREALWIRHFELKDLGA